ncbi:MAG TPA: penicillin-binding transpeptidase domain-containing protein, partial [Actinomycetota bacterium]|nr:penicillin-binding transpeptidase domain-containing protein [Actinomycetota bacterium]
LSVREYPKGPIASHLLGYVGEVNEIELAKHKGAYRLGDPIGRTGVERYYEQYLRGKPGYEKLEVDATGRVLRQLGYSPPEPGADLVLSIDAEVQKTAEQALAQGIARARGQTFRETGRRFKAPAGAAVVVDPTNGQVIAIASYPTFDLRKFVGGVEDEYFKYLNDPKNSYPLYNRAIQAAYPPGSTFKPIVATAALETGDAVRGDRYPCKTEFDIGGRPFRNWRPRNATISVAQSLIESCDTVYYYLAVEWWQKERAREKAGRSVYEVMPDWSRRFGLGTPTGIDLPTEAKGRVPDREWKQNMWDANRKEYCRKFQRTRERLWEDLCKTGYLWLPGDSANMSIGQGDVTATPMQMAMVYGAVANGGRVLEPRVALKVVRPDGAEVKQFRTRAKSVVRAKSSVFSYVRSALRGVVTAGTARFPYRGWPTGSIPVAAKTGSAEIAGKQPFSWFASYGPLDDPKYVTVAVVEEAGSGSQVSGPVVRRIMDEIFDLPPIPIVYGEASD